MQAKQLHAEALFVSVRPQCQETRAQELTGAILRCCHPCRFRLLNVRADVRFILVTDLVDWLGQFKLLAASPVITPANPNAPLQGHLMRTRDPRWKGAPCSRP